MVVPSTALSEQSCVTQGAQIGMVGRLDLEATSDDGVARGKEVRTFSDHVISRAVR